MLPFQDNSKLALKNRQTRNVFLEIYLTRHVVKSVTDSRGSEGPGEVASKRTDIRSRGTECHHGVRHNA